MQQRLNAFLILLIVCNSLYAQEHPSLILTREAVLEIRENLGSIPLFDASLNEVRAEVDSEIEQGVIVPIPKDKAGGYTHERHKRNFFMLQKAGVLYQILEASKYADYVKESLMAYAKMYRELPLHPETRSYARGKIFWQCLNDSNWLVYVSQAYDCIYNYLTVKERKYLEEELFRPYADFLSIENPRFFNRINNHSTWGNAAVGLIGLVMNDETLIQRALHGIKNAQIDKNARDNDGGRIKGKGEKEGFLENINAPFSPDGYYTEAPYYQRYAMYPFLLFAVGIENLRPEQKIFEYKDGVLIKAVEALLNLTDSDGTFFPLNDSQKGMSYYSRELMSAVDIAYHYGSQNQQLLSIAKLQGSVTLDDAGFAVAQAVKNNLAQPFKRQSMEFRDGAQGDEGGLAVVHSGIEEKNLNVVFKYTAQGNSHGHYDKLSFILNFKGEEILQDYGSARFVNIEQKSGGTISAAYLDENFSWAKLTLAHNTLSIDETPHYNGDYDIGIQHHGEKYFSHLAPTGHQLVSAKAFQVYEGVEMHRTLVLLEDKRLYQPLLLDLFRVNSDTLHQYDLPYHYFGQPMEMSFRLKKENFLEPLGKTHGYQHLWREASGKPSGDFDQFTWLFNNNFITLSMANHPNDTFLATRLGANDPNFNLRNDPSLIIRRKEAKNTLFANAIEIHGTYSTVTEIPIQSDSLLEKLTVVLDTEEYSAVRIDFKQGASRYVILSNQESSEKRIHSLRVEGEIVEWTGPYYINN